MFEYRRNQQKALRLTEKEGHRRKGFGLYRTAAKGGAKGYQQCCQALGIR